MVDVVGEGWPGAGGRKSLCAYEGAADGGSSHPRSRPSRAAGFSPLLRVSRQGRTRGTDPGGVGI